MTIERAIAALDRGDVDDAYRQLVLAWRAEPSDALALAAAEVWGAAPPRPIVGTAPWIAIAAARDPVDVPRLVRTLVAASISEIARFLPELEPFAADPMLAHELSIGIKELRWYSLRAIEVYRRMCALIARAAGPRELPFLEEALALAPRRDPAFRVELTELLTDLIATVRARPSITSDLSVLQPAIAELRARQAIRAERTRGLFAAVYAAPADDGPRLALADHLLEAGDPRGELIALQCQPSLDEAGTARVAEITSQYGRTWIEQAALLTRIEHFRFERGFPAAITGQADPRSVGAPAWSTIRHVTLRNRDEAAHAIFDPVCVSLEAVYQINAPTMLHALTVRQPTPIRELGFRYGEHGFEQLASVLHVFPHLRRLAIHARFELGLVGRVLTRRPLDLLHVEGAITQDHVNLLGSHLAELVAADRAYRLRFTRDAPDTGYLTLDDHGWEELVNLDLAVTPRLLVIDRLDPDDCEDCLAAVRSDVELAAQLGCEIAWR